ncbi:MAG: insulinase family protein [Rhodobacteraceae bacterium]|nr:insulinase family protein [Paracoccaceae bacterium]
MSVETHRLSNGLTIVAEHMPGLESSTVGVWVQAGARNEDAAQNGIAHFLEHMAFKGTKTRSALEIAEVIEDVGGFINAYTSREMTAYYTRVLGGDVPLALEVLGDILRNSTFDKREIEIERGVILSEIGQSLDTPDDVIFDWLQGVSYPDQAMGRPILGPAENVKRFSQADLSGFVDTHYGAENLVVSAAGMVDFAALVKQAEALFGDMPKSAAPAAEASRFIGGEKREEKDLEQAHFTLGFAAPSIRDANVYTAQVYSMLLGGGMTSRLFQEAREKRGLCYSIYASISPGLENGMLTIYSGTSGEQISELAEVTIAEMKRAVDDISEVELARAQVQMKAGMLMGLESPSARAERMARAIAIWGKVPDLSEAVAKIEAVSVIGLRAYAASVCAAQEMSMALYGPISGAPLMADLHANLRE